MDDDLKRQAQAIIRAISGARVDLRGSGPPRKRVGTASLRFSSYTNAGPLAAHVRDVYNAQTLRGMTAALNTLERMARAIAQPEEGQGKKLRPDVAETAFRIMQEATGQAPKTKPPGERADEEKHPEAVARGSKGGKKGGKARADKLTPEQREEIAQTAALARWRKKD